MARPKRIERTRHFEVKTVTADNAAVTGDNQRRGRGMTHH
jgi:hypothetical protein